MKRRWNVKSSIEDEYEKKTFRILYIKHNKKTQTDWKSDCKCDKM